MGHRTLLVTANNAGTLTELLGLRFCPTGRHPQGEGP
jgi:hypothetical protein